MFSLKSEIYTSEKSRKFRPNGKAHFRVRLYIDAADGNLNNITLVEYLLHSSFKDRKRVGTNPSNKFEVEFYAWGTFPVKVTIHHSDGVDQFTHDFGEDFKEL